MFGLQSVRGGNDCYVCFASLQTVSPHQESNEVEDEPMVCPQAEKLDPGLQKRIGRGLIGDGQSFLFAKRWLFFVLNSAAEIYRRLVVVSLFRGFSLLGAAGIHWWGLTVVMCKIFRWRNQRTPSETWNCSGNDLELMESSLPRSHRISWFSPLPILLRL